MHEFKVGDKVIAYPNSTSEIWSNGTVGVIAEIRDERAYSGNDSNNLIRWNNGEGILVGFHPNDILPVGDRELPD